MSEAERQRESRREGEAIETERVFGDVGSCLGQAAMGCVGALVLGFGLVLVLLVATGCEDDESPNPGHLVQWEGPVYQSAGSPNAERTSEFDGWEHCGWQSARFLVVPAVYVAGHDSLPEDIQRYPWLTFVRDRKHVLRANVVGTLDLDASLPGDAMRTPYTQKGRELWFSPSESATGAYVVDGSTVERWPRFDGGCD
jgi:hypothetical protein